jgi:hypothetical protein
MSSSSGITDDKSFEASAIADVTNSNVLDDEIPNSKETEKKEKMPEVKWSTESEKIPSEWCDVAKCYKWLHNRSHQKFSILHAWFTIPAIIFSTISGTASFAQTSLPLSMQAYAPMVIGSVNIIIGILTTIQQYMKISELNESYRVSAIAWDKFARNISIELAKAPEERSMDAGHFLKTYREEFDRLMETSPSIPKSITLEFIAIFSGKKPYYCWPAKDDADDEENNEEERKTRFKTLKKPDECDTIIVSEIGKHDWYNPSRIPTIQMQPTIDENSIENMLSQKIKGIQEMARKEEEDKRKSIDEYKWMEEEKNKMEKEEQERKEKIQQQFRQMAIESSNKKNINKKKIEEHINLFKENYGRDPLKEELSESLKIEVDAEILATFLDKYVANGLADNNV